MLERIPRRERLDLVIAWLAIAVAFTLIFVRNHVDPLTALAYFGISLLTVGVGFVLHELAHKFTAMRFGYWAEFRKDNQMLLVAVVLAALVGVVFAAPGATVVYGDRIDRRQEGLISAAGPVTSLVLALGFAGLFLAVPPGGILWLLGLFGMRINAMLAAFNMLPVSVLDGRKVLAWHPLVFVVLIAASFVMVYLTYVL
ncbi:MAG TPA: peptidase M50 [Methanoregulaceae archaeon]|nr:peptidase M50 [Methanoregulaceae archaeon]HOV68187.1 peptidase M50 [Methanoregulaceae archaeon]HQJ87330.1 peptidase M50 [Methanoregulaceae archaeon]